MSLRRLVYYGAILGGWSAFFGWLIAEFLIRSKGLVGVALTCGLVGGTIGAGLNLVAGMANGQWRQLLKRLVPGLVGGGIGGAVGGTLGELAYVRLNLPREIGWMLMGAAIGVVEGLTEGSRVKLRNGLIGGVIGGVIGGFLLERLSPVIPSQLRMITGAAPFVILGMFIGVLIGVVKVAFKEAWLTVVDGYRNGRQLILAEDSAVLGKAEYASLPFIGRNDAAELEPEHARIRRQPDGRFLVEDNHTRTGVRVNDVRVVGSMLLKDGDIIKLGMNQVRFSEKRRDAAIAGPGSGGQPNLHAPAQPAARGGAVGSPPQPLVAEPSPPIAAPVAPPPRSPIPPPKPAAVAPPRPPIPAQPPPRPPIPAQPAPRPGAVAPPRPPIPAQPAPRPGAVAPPRPPIPAQPAPRPGAVAPPRPQAPVQPQPAGRMQEGMIACPNCGRAVPKGPRYCIICDLNF